MDKKYALSIETNTYALLSLDEGYLSIVLINHGKALKECEVTWQPSFGAIRLFRPPVDT
jgi:hypothetical protein